MTNDEREKTERDRLEFCIHRYDHYFDSLNSKSTVYLTLTTFLVGGLLAGYTQLDPLLDYTIIFKFMYILPILLGLITMTLIIYSSVPYLSKNSKSIYYFGGVAARLDEDFCKKSQTISNEDELDDLRNQTHILSCGLVKKYDKLKYAGYLILTQFTTVFALFIYIIINLK